jgi:hypothetical protein
MQYDVKSGLAFAGATTVVFAGPARVKGLVVSYSAAGGTVYITDGTANVFYFSAPAVAGATNVIIPGEGIRCSTNVAVTCPANVVTTVFYG